MDYNHSLRSNRLVITILVILVILLPMLFLIFAWYSSPPQTKREIVVLVVVVANTWVASLANLATILGFNLRDIWGRKTEVIQEIAASNEQKRAPGLWQNFMGRVRSFSKRIGKVDLLIALVSAVILFVFWSQLQLGYVVYQVDGRIQLVLITLLSFSSIMLIPRILAPNYFDLLTKLLRFICFLLICILAAIIIFFAIRVDKLPTQVPTTTPTPPVTSTSEITSTPVIPTPTCTTWPTCTPTPQPTSRPLVIVSPPYGPVGTQFLFKGSGFTPNELIQRYIAGPDEKYVDLESIRADKRGDFARAFIPDDDWQAGTYIYTAHDTYTSSSASTSFTIITPAYVSTGVNEPTKAYTPIKIPTPTPIPPTSTPATPTRPIPQKTPTRPLPSKP
jgi:hypothetical protein